MGWLNARGDGANGSVIGQFYCSGYIWGANVGWIGLGAGQPTNGWSYGNAAVDDWGVNHDGEGNLTGHAYGANIGWITFEQTHGQPRIDLLTGAMSGYVWSGNIGWISLSNAQAFVKTDSLDAGPDTDADGIPDAYEYKYAGNLTTLQGGGHDADADGMSDVREYLAGTDPLDDGSLLQLVASSLGAEDNLFVWPAVPTRFYQLETTTNLLATAFGDSGLGLMASEGGVIIRELPEPEAGTAYYRVKAVLPLSEP